jgi:lipopolysaccharide transport system permease protein
MELDANTKTAAEPHGEAPEIVIRPVSAFSLEDIREIWRRRELIWTLGLRDVKVRYTQAALGVAWALVQPLAQMIIFTVLFNRLAKIDSGSTLPYPVFAFAGLVPWTLFASGLQNASDSLVSSADLVTKVYFPRVVLPLAAIITALVDFAIGFVLLAILLVAWGVTPQVTWLLALPIGLLPAACAAAIGLWTSAINLRFRDVRYALPFFFQILLYVTPVFYPPKLVPERYRWLLDLNPMTAILESFRAALSGSDIPWARLGIATGIIVVVGVVGFANFKRLEQTFADRI